MSSAGQSTIEMKNISVKFPGVQALDNVTCIIKTGEVRALVGANGAGKSTLMKALSGVNSHYTGEIIIDGNAINIRSTTDARKQGIEIVYQEVDSALVPELSIAENVMMEHLVFGHSPIVNWKYLRNEAIKALERLNLSINPKRLVSTLTLAQKQMILIARAMVTNCRYLILDEPTAPLSQPETQKLFEVVRQLKTDGVGIVFISHRLNELFEICDEITVLRDGKNVGESTLISEVTIAGIVAMMLGHSYGEEIGKSGREIGKPLLRVSSLSDKKKRIHNIDMIVHEGEIVGLFGLIGAGKTELCKTLFGAFGKANGSIELNGNRIVCKNPADAVKAGFAFIPEERRKEGVVLDDPVYQNLSLVTLSKYVSRIGFIRKKKELIAAEENIEKLQILTPSLSQKVAFLSGGNQQKVIIGKWLDSSSMLFIYDEPTKGIDVKAKSEVYQLIMESARKGFGIIYASSEQTEIMNLTDRVYVMYDGTIQGEFITEETTEDELMLYSTGGKKGEQ